LARLFLLVQEPRHGCGRTWYRRWRCSSICVREARVVPGNAYPGTPGSPETSHPHPLEPPFSAPAAVWEAISAGSPEYSPMARYGNTGRALSYRASGTSRSRYHVPSGSSLDARTAQVKNRTVRIAFGGADSRHTVSRTLERNRNAGRRGTGRGAPGRSRAARAWAGVSPCG
jgi:hypothetical protein